MPASPANDHEFVSLPGRAAKEMAVQNDHECACGLSTRVHKKSTNSDAAVLVVNRYEHRDSQIVLAYPKPYAFLPHS